MVTTDFTMNEKMDWAKCTRILKKTLTNLFGRRAVSRDFKQIIT